MRQREFDAGTDTKHEATPARMEGIRARSMAGADELEILAGFLTWLVRQQIPKRRREQYSGSIESYLGWRAGQRHRSPTASQFVLEAGGSRENARPLEASFALLRRYLLAASHRRTGSSNPLWSQLPAELAR